MLSSISNHLPAPETAKRPRLTGRAPVHGRRWPPAAPNGFRPVQPAAQAGLLARPALLVDNQCTASSGASTVRPVALVRAVAARTTLLLLQG
jgi:hypothetical protein